MNRIHVHKVEWHEFGMHLGHLLRDPRFWAIVAIVTLLGLLIWVGFMTNTGNLEPSPVFPVYPYGMPVR